MGFLQLLHLMLPSVFPSDPITWEPYGQHLPEGDDHRLLFPQFTKCLIHAVYYDSRDFETMIAPASQSLREAAPTAASSFLSELEQMARSVVLFRRLNMVYDLRKELGELRARCPLHIWVSPTLELPARTSTNSR